MKTEAKVQQEMVVWFRNNYQRKGVDKGIIFSVPNERAGGYMAMKDLLLTGLLSGVSDLIVVLKGKVLFVEVKNEKGKQSPKQILFQKQVENLGFKYYLVRNLEDFKKVIK
ncbi:MAG: VRR-NUC domain-containing protein [Deltaproteobacteria bacterium]|nr:VRR-NUC domain-containing protein [Deltaproteobacteria bacterium]